jgi:alkylhydroperoxidase/carboxymuconolactone decarboxylase family protein YurZ
MQVSRAFELFANEAPEYHGAWMEAVKRLGAAGCLDKKTKELVYIAVLAALRLECGWPLIQKPQFILLTFIAISASEF